MTKKIIATNKKTGQKIVFTKKPKRNYQIEHVKPKRMA